MTSPSSADTSDRKVELYGRPTASELLVAAREFLAGEVMAATEGHVQFHTRVTLRVLDTVLREMELAPRHLAEHGHRLDDLGYRSDWELVEAIRQGVFDGLIAELAGRLEPDVRAKLEVADPRYID